jgi:hypothetical protein
MITIQRETQRVRPGKWAELEEIDKRFNAVQSRCGFPAKKRFQCIAGGHDTNTLIIERQWESMAAMEAAYDKFMSTPEYQTLGVEVFGVIESDQIELYAPLP